jgi:hypothetical protein
MRTYSELEKTVDGFVENIDGTPTVMIPLGRSNESVLATAPFT